MIENIAKPIQNKQVKTNLQQLQATEPEVEDVAFKREPKDPNTVTNKTTQVNKAKEKEYDIHYEWNDFPVTEQPLFRVASDALNLTVNQAEVSKNEVAEIVILGMNLLEKMFDEPDEEMLFRFLRKKMMKVPQNGSIVNGLLRNLKMEGGGTLWHPL